MILSLHLFFSLFIFLLSFFVITLLSFQFLFFLSNSKETSLFLFYSILFISLFSLCWWKIGVSFCLLFQFSLQYTLHISILLFISFSHYNDFHFSSILSIVILFLCFLSNASYPTKPYILLSLIAIISHTISSFFIVSCTEFLIRQCRPLFEVSFSEFHFLALFRGKSS